PYPPHHLALPETPFVLRNLACRLTGHWVDNFGTDLARTAAERAEHRRTYDFSLRLLEDPKYRHLVIQLAWTDSFRKCRTILKTYRVLLLAGEGVGVDFFARLLLRQLAEKQPTLRKGLQFVDLDAFNEYQPQDAFGAGFILRNVLDQFLGTRPVNQTLR